MTSSRLENPFTRVLTTEELEKAASFPVPVKNPREVAVGELIPPGAPRVTADERVAVVKKIDEQIRERATRAVGAMTRFAEVSAGGGADMSDEELLIARLAMEPTKSAAMGLTVALRIYESFQKQEGEERRPLAVTINMFGDGSAQQIYERIKVEK